MMERSKGYHNEGIMSRGGARIFGFKLAEVGGGVDFPEIPHENEII